MDWDSAYRGAGAFEGPPPWNIGEPQPELASYLERACAAARLSNVSVERCALSDAEGERELLVPSDGFTQGASLEGAIGAERPCRAVVVRTTTLDRYLQGNRVRVAAITLDVEGHEPALLRGAERTLEEHRPLLVLECEERHLGPGGTARLFAWLHERGYDGDFVERGRSRPLKRAKSTCQRLACPIWIPLSTISGCRGATPSASCLGTQAAYKRSPCPNRAARRSP